jgi:hypothetical protein
MHSYTVARFDPNTTDPHHPIQTRIISAESEDAAIDLMTDPGDGSYWEVIETNDPSVTRLNGGKA